MNFKPYAHCGDNHVVLKSDEGIYIIGSYNMDDEFAFDPNYATTDLLKYGRFLPLEPFDGNEKISERLEDLITLTQQAVEENINFFEMFAKTLED